MHHAQPLRRSVAAACLTTLVFAAPARADTPAVLRERCAGCHTDGGGEGGLDLDALLTALGRGRPTPGSAEHTTWQAVWRNVRAGTMPPADEAQPTAEERATIVRFVQHDVFGLDPARPDPGHVVLRRLNRDEYARTVRDLLGVSFNVSDAFPADDTGYGFDTIGAVLSVSPLLMEKYLEAAREIGRAAVAPLRAAKRDKEGRLHGPRESRAVFFEGPPPDDEASHPVALRRLLERLATRAFRRPVDAVTLDALVHLASDAAGMPNADDATPGGGRRAAVSESTGGTQPDGRHGKDPDATASTADAARRRFEDAVEIGITALLGAPRFVYRIEAADPAATLAPAGGGEPIDEFSLASRLSYFLWGTMPDDSLLELAAAGKLRERLDATVDRMIDDPRSDAFIASFTGQWLQIRDIETIAFDARRILGVKDSGEAAKLFSGDVRRAMRQETELLFAHVLREGLPATDLLVTRTTFLNRPLARFYGLESLLEAGGDGGKNGAGKGHDDGKGGTKGDGKAMRQVVLPDHAHRGGLLTHGSVLAVTSNPTRTSPVKRGLFVLENLLGTPAPPAPPDVPALEQAAATRKDATMRELMAAHREAPLCSSCHARMDPLGLALESYDALGRYRDSEGGQPIDTAGRLITGETFSDAMELANRIAVERRTDFHRCVTEKMLTFAIGRGMEYFDAPAVDTIVERFATDGSLRGLVHAIVRSVPFQRMRRALEETPP